MYKSLTQRKEAKKHKKPSHYFAVHPENCESATKNGLTNNLIGLDFFPIPSQNGRRKPLYSKLRRSPP